jgi:cellulose synthase/poly-beta-1,6-N-acetylglucosamine synthase-like glycosyltransferase/peptidoglycan/xylan/chitin deacetylase (PgdA/CDA1 family)
MFLPGSETKMQKVSNTSESLVVRSSNELSKHPKQVFTDESGKRWAVSKYIIGLVLIGSFVLSYFGLESAYNQTNSLLQLQAQEQIAQPIETYPALVEFGTNDYDHLKEYFNNYSEVLYKGDLTNGTGELTVHAKHLKNIPKFYVLDYNRYESTNIELLIKNLTTNTFSGVVFENLPDTYSEQQIDQLAIPYLNADLTLSTLVEPNFEPLWSVVNYKNYRKVNLESLENPRDIKSTNLDTLLFDFEYKYGDNSVSALDFQKTLKTDTVISYNNVGKFDSYKILNSTVVGNYLRLFGSWKDFGFYGIGDIDSRAVSLKSANNLQAEYHISTNVNTTGFGEMFYLLQEPVPTKSTYIDQSGLIVEERITQEPVQAQVRRYGQKTGSINLSFDDGPDPVWTPQILDILKKENVKATFYVLGINVNKHPEIAKRIVDEGHEIANHSYLHPKSWELEENVFKAEIEETQAAIFNATGVKARYFRTPYNDTDNYTTHKDLKNLRILQEMGLQVSEFDVDTKDYTQPGTEQIVKSIQNGLDSGSYSQILYHDKGGDRIQTIESLPLVIQEVKNRKINFVTADELNYIEPATTNKSLDFWNIKSNISFINSTLIAPVLGGYVFVFAYLMMVKFVLSLFLFGLAVLRKRSYTSDQPGVSVIIPAYNESMSVVETVYSVLKSNYPKLEIIVVNDGSKDNTLELLQSKFTHHPKVTIVDQVNGGKSSASNNGITHAKYDFIMSIDADTYMKVDTIEFMMRNFINENIAGVAGNVHIGNYDNFLTQTQRSEYIYSQVFDKEIHSLLNSIPVVPGAIGIWRKSVLLEVGGYTSETLAEDTDLTLKIRKLGYKIVFERAAVVVTEAPATMREFLKQRNRWMYGTLQCIWKHKEMVFNPKYGYLGLVILPEIIFSFLFIGLAGYMLYMLVLLLVSFGIAIINNRSDITNLMDTDLLRTLALLLASLALYYFTQILALALDKNNNKWSVLFYLPYQMVVYRVILWWVQLTVVFKAIKGTQQSWNYLTRKGLKSQNPPVPTVV